MSLSPSSWACHRATNQSSNKHTAPARLRYAPSQIFTIFYPECAQMKAYRSQQQTSKFCSFTTCHTSPIIVLNTYIYQELLEACTGILSLILITNPTLLMRKLRQGGQGDLPNATKAADSRAVIQTHFYLTPKDCLLHLSHSAKPVHSYQSKFNC